MLSKSALQETTNASSPFINLSPARAIPLPASLNRKNYNLPTVSKEIIKFCLESADQICRTTYRKGSCLKRPSMEILGDQLASRGIIDYGVVGLSIFLSCAGNNPKGTFTKLPDRFFSPEVPGLDQRVQLIGQYAFSRKNGIRTAAQLEAIDGWNALFNGWGFGQAVRREGVIPLLKKIYPTEFEGDDPPIREWCISEGTRWKSGRAKRSETLNLAKRAFRWVVQYGERVAYADGTYDLDKVKRTQWGVAFHKPEYGLRGLVGSQGIIKNSFDGLTLGAPGLVGLNGEPLRPWQIRHNMWVGKGGKALVKAVAQYIVETKLRLVDENGTPDPEKIKAVNDWSCQFRAEAPGAMRKVDHAHQLLKMTYPHLFGWDAGKILPGEIKYCKMWHGAEGKRLFQLRLAFALKGFYHQHFPEEEPLAFNAAVPFPLRFSPLEALRIRYALLEHGNSWQDLLAEMGFAAALRTVAGSAVTNALALVCPPSKRNSGAANLIEVLLHEKVDLVRLLYGLLENVDEDVPLGRGQGLKIGAIENLEMTGIESTCLAPFLGSQPPSKSLRTTEVMYKALRVALTPSGTSLQATKSESYKNVLQLIFDPGDSGKPKAHLSDHDSKELLRVVNRTIVPNIVPAQSSEQLHTLVEAMLARDEHVSTLIRAACELDPCFRERRCALSDLEEAISYLLDLVQSYELRTVRLNGEPSPIFRKYFKHVAIEGREDETEEGDEVLAVETLDLRYKHYEPDTLAIFLNRKAEDPLITATLVRAACKDRFRRRLMACLSEGDFVDQVRILHEFRDRAHTRHLKRFDYATLRIRPQFGIDRILRIEDQTLKFKEFVRCADKSLWEYTPLEWPVGVVPVHFYAHTLHCLVVAPPSKDVMLTITKCVSGPQMEFYVVPEEILTLLSLEFQRTKRHVSNRSEVCMLPTPFLSNEEKDRVFHAVVALRMNVRAFLAREES